MLTEHQQRVMIESINILERSNRLLIKGSAGVGKTFMVKELIKALGAIGEKTICSAPTHKAVAVIKEKVSLPVIFTTIHSALKMRRSIGRGGEWEFKPSFNPNWPPLKGVKYLIIDEVSMISEENLEYIEEFASVQGTKVVFIGDDKQLNPVNDEDSPVFQRNYPTVELTEIIRQGSGNPIIDLSRNLNSISSGVNKLIGEKGFVYTQNKERIINELARVNGTDEFKYLSYTNQDVNHINKLVRERIYGTPAKIEEGETMVFNAPYGEDYSTNQELYVDTVEVKEDKFSFKFNNLSHTAWLKAGENDDEKPYQTIKLKYYCINDHIDVIHEESEKALKNLLSVLKSKCKRKELEWKDFYTFAETFADLKYNHALTIHKSQGSTYKQAVINLTNISLNRKEKERKRLLYTAITRASDLLIIYQK